VIVHTRDTSPGSAGVAGPCRGPGLQRRRHRGRAATGLRLAAAAGPQRRRGSKPRPVLSGAGGPSRGRSSASPPWPSRGPVLKRRLRGPTAARSPALRFPPNAGARPCRGNAVVTGSLTHLAIPPPRIHGYGGRRSRGRPVVGAVGGSPMIVAHNRATGLSRRADCRLDDAISYESNTREARRPT
jgi:hypothetical protein